MKRRADQRQPFSLSGISKVIMIASCVLGPFLALGLVGLLLQAWIGKSHMNLATQLSYLALVAELVLFLPLVIIAFVLNARKDTDLELRLKRMSGIARAVLLWIVIFVATSVVSIITSGSVAVTPGGGALILFLVNWQDLKSWRKFHEHLMRQKQKQATALDPPPGECHPARGAKGLARAGQPGDFPL